MAKTIKEFIKFGKNHAVEYRARFLVDDYDTIGQVICSFLNGSGGYIVFGVDDQGVFVGNEVDDRMLAEFQEAIYQDITPKALFSYEIYGDEVGNVLSIEVPAGNDYPYAYKNDIYVRNRGKCAKASVDIIRDLITGRQTEPERWERRYSIADVEDDLSDDEIRKTQNDLRQSPLIKLHDANNVISILEDLSIFRYGKLTNAGDILFAKNPSQRYPQTRVKAVCILENKTDNNYKDFNTFEGPLISTLESVYDFVIRNIPIQSSFPADRLERIDEPVYPIAAIREGLVKEIAA